MNTKTLITTVLFLMSISGQSQRLDAFLTDAAHQNLSLKQAYIDFEIEIQNIASAKDLPDPTISFGYFIQPIETRLGPQQTKFSLKQKLPWFGTLSAKEDIYKHKAQVKFKAFEAQKAKLYLEVESAYYPMLELKEHIVLQDEFIKVLKADKRLTTSFYKNGKGSQVDILNVDLKLIEARTEKQKLEDVLRSSKIRFNTLLNRELSTPIVFVDSLYTTTYNQDSKTFNNHPAIERVDEQILMTEASKQYALKTGKPNLMFGIDYFVIGELNQSTDPENGRDALLPTIQLSIPLFSKREKSEVKIAELNKAKLVSLKQERINALEAEWEQQIIRLKSDHRDLMTYNKQIEQRLRILKLLYVEYQNAELDFNRILDQKEDLLKLKQKRLQVLKRIKVSQASLNYLSYTSIQ